MKLYLDMRFYFVITLLVILLRLANARSSFFSIGLRSYVSIIRFVVGAERLDERELYTFLRIHIYKALLVTIGLFWRDIYYLYYYPLEKQSGFGGDILLS